MWYWIVMVLLVAGCAALLGGTFANIKRNKAEAAGVRRGRSRSRRYDNDDDDDEEEDYEYEDDELSKYDEEIDYDAYDEYYDEN